MSVNKSTVRIGSDFEMFLMDKNGKVISAIPFIQGTKHKPQQLSKKGCCIQHDGVLSECNVPEVSLDEADVFSDNIEFVTDFIYDSFARKEGLRLMCCPSAEVEEDQLQDDEARAFGCDPSYSAWDDGNIIEKNFPEGIKLRSCGGHIHISYEGANVDTSLELMRAFDLFVTVPFVLLDEDTRRRELYGKAGEFRLQQYGDNTYGFEARTLSNIWVNSRELVEFVFNQLNNMFDFYNENGIASIDAEKENIVKAINEGNKELANKLCDKFNILLPIAMIEEYA